MAPGANGDGPGFSLDGQVYPIPTLDSFNLDETIVLYDYCGLTMEDFAPAGEEDDPEEYERDRRKKMSHPGFLKALLHVAYARGNPKLPAGRVKAVVGQANFISSVEDLLETGEEDEAVDPTQEPTSELEPSSPRSSEGSSESSGTPSSSDSDAPVVHPLPSTGTTR